MDMFKGYEVIKKIDLYSKIILSDLTMFRVLVYKFESWSIIQFFII